MEERISDTIVIIKDFAWYYWVKTKDGMLTGKIYKDKEECIRDAKKLDAEKNGA